MITDLKPYGEYKESGLPWLGQVPGHWSTRRMKFLFRERSEKGHPNEPLLAATQTKGVVRKEDYGLRTVTAMNGLEHLKLVEVGDFVISLRSFQGGIEVSHAKGIISPAYTVLCPRSGFDPNYFRVYFKCADFISSLTLFVTGIREGQNIDYERLSRAFVPLPHPDEQAAIVRFLDWANGRLERAVRAKRKVIALLNEQKLAIIHRAVTRGLDPNVPLKDSGVPWLGEIPKHWEVRKIRAVASRVTKGTTPTTLGKQFVDSGVRFVKVESISSNRNILENKCAFIDDATDKLLSRSRLRANDVVVSIAGAIGRPAVIEPSLLPANTNQAVGIVSLLAHLCRPEWLSYILASPMCLRAMTDASVQSAQANLSLANLGRTVMPLPPLHEQESILMSLASETAVLSRAISRLEREITLLREYRTRLVADVVTGKLDVRVAAAALPDEAPLDMESDSELETDEAEAADEGAP